MNLSKPKNRLASRAASRTGKPRLQLKGRIFIQNITDILKNEETRVTTNSMSQQLLSVFLILHKLTAPTQSHIFSRLSGEVIPLLKVSTSAFQTPISVINGGNLQLLKGTNFPRLEILRVQRNLFLFLELPYRIHTTSRQTITKMTKSLASATVQR